MNSSRKFGNLFHIDVTIPLDEKVCFYINSFSLWFSPHAYTHTHRHASKLINVHVFSLYMFFNQCIFWTTMLMFTRVEISHAVVKGIAFS